MLVAGQWTGRSDGGWVKIVPVRGEGREGWRRLLCGTIGVMVDGGSACGERIVRLLGDVTWRHRVLKGEVKAELGERRHLCGEGREARERHERAR